MLDGVRWKLTQARRQVKKEWRAHQRRSHAQGMVLMYHRVTEKDVDPWSLGVTPENFEAHLQVINQQMRPMALKEFALAQQNGTLPDRAVAITFDDGYANNLHRAKPLLARYGIPATVFVSTGYTERSREFWWDELERILLQPGELPETLTLNLNGQEQQWRLGTAATYREADYQADYEIAAWDAEPGSRLYFYHSVWAALQPLAEFQRQLALETLIDWAKATHTPRETHRPMTCEELRLLEADNVVSIGAHTVNHPLLSRHTIDHQQAEILASKVYLERVLNHSIETFAYPFGAYCPETLPLLAQADFLCACTTVEETVWQGNQRHELPRFDIANWSGPIFEKQIRQWLKKGYAA